jgi:hypothetical protein
MTRKRKGSMKKRKIGDFGDLFTMEEFVEMTNSGFITPYDGSGNLSDGEFEYEGFKWTQEEVDSYTHMVWYNK